MSVCVLLSVCDKGLFVFVLIVVTELKSVACSCLSYGKRNVISTYSTIDNW